MNTILHISDLHIGERGKADAARGLVTSILKYAASAERSPVVIITGDVVGCGTAEEYELALEILRPLAAATLLLVVPGNHDVVRVGVHLSPAYDSRARDRFTSFVSQLTGLDAPPDTWPVVYEDAGTRFILVDTNLPQVYLARGHAGYAQRMALAKELQAAKERGLRTVVAMHHHPITHNGTLLLQDAGEVLACLSARTDLLLFGHMHQAGEWSGVHGIGRIIAADQSTASRRVRVIKMGGPRIESEWMR